MSITSELLKEFNIKLKKSLGQNFLSDQRVAERISTAEDFSECDLIIEIGAGAGTLTEELLKFGKRTITFEIDRRLEPLLEKRFNGNEKLEMKFMDFFEFIPTDDFLSGKAGFISNLPYCSGTAIIAKIFENFNNFKLGVFMLQKEVAQRILALPSTSNYGFLSVYMNYYTIPEKILDVSPSHFIPNPKIDSSVLAMRPKDRVLSLFEENIFFRFVKRSFSNRRKMMKNNFIYPEKIEAILLKTGLKKDVRAENLSVDDFLRFFNIFRYYEDEDGD